jgi:hypothetical protein
MTFHIFNYKISNFKNYRNTQGLPSRGQRTHTNAKTKKNLKLKSILRLRSFFKNNKTAINPIIYLLNKNFSFILNFKIKRNNVFCSLIETTTKRTLLLISSGKEKIKTSKKTLKFSQ